MRLFEKIRTQIQVDDATWTRYTNHFRRTEVPAKTILLREGDISGRLFLIEKGCVRAWFDNDGNDVTFQFFFENQTVASMESFRKKIPSVVTIETLEPSVLWVIEKKDMEKIIHEISEIPDVREKFIQAIFERTFDYMKQYLSFIKDTPQQRYLNLIKDKPLIVKRVPQRYIASYLGISPVHLSRIRNKIGR